MVSIIVPCKNGEKYIRRCVDSILHQTYSDIELIVIEDGSTDSTYAILKQYGERDSRVVIVKNEKNQGIAKSRELGIAKAKGEFITFVDADDWIDPDLIEKMADGIGDSDFIECQWWVEKETGRSRNCGGVPEGVYSEENGNLSFFRQNMIYTGNTESETGLSWTVWSKLYKAELVKKAYPYVNKNLYHADDSEFAWICGTFARSIRISNICGYHYFMHAESITHRLNRHCFLEADAVYNDMYAFFSRQKDAEQLLDQFAKVFLLFIYYFMRGELGLSDRSRPSLFICPFSEIKGRIILYGAGEVGRDYYNQFLNRKQEISVTAWVDRNYENIHDTRMKTEAPESIKDKDFDYVIVAIKNERAYTEIKKYLCGLGIEEAKILWRPPVKVV